MPTKIRTYTSARTCMSHSVTAEHRRTWKRKYFKLLESYTLLLASTHGYVEAREPVQKTFSQESEVRTAPYATAVRATRTRAATRGPKRRKVLRGCVQGRGVGQVEGRGDGQVGGARVQSEAPQGGTAYDAGSPGRAVSSSVRAMGMLLACRMPFICICSSLALISFTSCVLQAQRKKAQETLDFTMKELENTRSILQAEKLKSATLQKDLEVSRQLTMASEAAHSRLREDYLIDTRRLKRRLDVEEDLLALAMCPLDSMASIGTVVGRLRTSTKEL
jgi:hypothetical protein